jgi:8-oxo-dGTP pyrophosphatase MutT (NUDIX family)
MTQPKNNFEICARGIVQHQGKILICYCKNKSHYFFPGGHIEFGENAKEALAREMEEELGVSVKKCLFIGTVENIYLEDNQKHHEINIVFKIEIDRISDKSKEDHLEFSLVNIDKFSQENVLPIALKKAILKWLKDKKIFWASQTYNKSLVVDLN